LTAAIGGAEIADFAGVVRILEQRPEDFLLRRFVRRAVDQFEVEESGARLQHVDGLREAAGVDEEALRS
jgi:ATP-dependent RNA circularization protein (DNA/RNA ligase family)